MPMIVAACTATFHIPFAHSLKDKRQVVQSLMKRVRNSFNVSIAEIEEQDRWQTVVFGIACVSNSAQYAHGQMDAVVRFMEETRPDVPLVTYSIEMR